MFICQGKMDMDVNSKQVPDIVEVIISSWKTQGRSFLNSMSVTYKHAWYFTDLTVSLTRLPVTHWSQILSFSWDNKWWWKKYHLLWSLRLFLKPFVFRLYSFFPSQILCRENKTTEIFQWFLVYSRLSIPMYSALWIKHLSLWNICLGQS